MNNLQIFKNNEFGELRVVEINNEGWIVGKDVTEKLGYQNGSRDINRHVDEEDRQIIKIHDGYQLRDMIIINESGLYALVLGSELPNARRFRRWVTNEVLPTIRKHGAYLTPEKIEEVLMDPDTIIRLATNLKEEQQKRLQAEKQLELNKPKVVFAEALEISENSILVGELAKLLARNGIENMGQNRLFKWLRNKGYLHKSGEQYNLPTQYSIELGLIETKTTTINNPDGSVRVTKTPKITGKGQIYFVNKFKEKEIA